MTKVTDRKKNIIAGKMSKQIMAPTKKPDVEDVCLQGA